MNNIEVSGRVFSKYKKLASKVANEVLEKMHQPKGLEIAIEFVSEKEIRRLNNQMREIDKVTDVLSFPSTELKAGEVLDVSSPEIEFLKTDKNFIHFGDMAICFKQTKRQAKEFGVSVLDEIKKLVIHSVLHLMGYDHIEDKDYEIMNKNEIELDKSIKI